MDKHLKFSIVAQVILGASVYGACIARGEVADVHRQRLLIQLDGHRRRAVPFLALNAWRQDIGYRVPASVLLDIDGTDAERRVGPGASGIVSRLQQVLGVLPPRGIHQLKGGETQNDGFLEIAQEHTHESYRMESVQLTHQLVVLADWDTELIPLAGGGAAIGQHDIGGFLYVDNVVLANLHVGGVKFYQILVVVLSLTEGIVLVDVLDIGVDGCRRGIRLGVVGIHGRVAFGVVVVLVTVVDFHISLVIVCPAVIVEVIGRRVGIGQQVGR